MLYMVACVVIVMGALGAVSALVNPPTVQGGSITERIGDLIPPLGEPFPGRTRINVLLLGSDEVEGTCRSDTMMVLLLNPKLKRAALLSIPRDSRVEIPGHGRNKINAAYAFGGVELAQETVEELLDIRIDYYVQIGFDAFVGAVDELGGVDIEVPDPKGRGEGLVKPTYYDPINLKPGYQHLNGKQALQFARYRDDSDIERTKRQQQLLRALTDQKFNVWNVFRLMRAGSKLLDRLITDIKWDAAVDFIKIMQKIPASEIMTATVPTGDRYIDGIYYGIVHQNALADLLDDMDDYLSRVSLPGATVEVANGSGVVGAAQVAAELLTEAGFEIADVGNADSFDYDHTVINHRTTARKAAREVKQVLKLPQAELVEQREWHGSLDLEVAVVLGKDFDAERSTDSELP